MADFTTVDIFPTCGENSHFPVSKQMMKVQLSLDMLGKLTCFTRGEHAIVNWSDCSTHLCCKLQTHWQLFVFPTSKINSYFFTYFERNGSFTLWTRHSWLVSTYIFYKKFEIKIFYNIFFLKGHFCKRLWWLKKFYPTVCFHFCTCYSTQQWLRRVLTLLNYNNNNLFLFSPIFNNKNHDFLIVSFKIPPFCYLLIKMVISSTERSHEHSEFMNIFIYSWIYGRRKNVFELKKVLLIQKHCL